LGEKKRGLHDARGGEISTQTGEENESLYARGDEWGGRAKREKKKECGGGVRVLNDLTPASKKEGATKSKGKKAFMRYRSISSEEEGGLGRNVAGS